MMDVKLTNHAFLYGLIVEIFDEEGLVGSGRIVLHTRDTIKLSDGMYYYKDKFELRIMPKQPQNNT
jgi:hypothetical protein